MKKILTEAYKKKLNYYSNAILMPIGFIFLIVLFYLNIRTNQNTKEILQSTVIIKSPTDKNKISNTILSDFDFSSDKFTLGDLMYFEEQLDYWKTKANILKSIKENDYHQYNISEVEANELACINMESRDKSQLTGGATFQYIELTKNSKTKLNLFGLTSTDFEKNTKYLIIDYIAYKDSFCLNNKNESIRIKLISGIRIKAKIKNCMINVDVNTLEKIAALRELNIAGIEIRIEFIGWQPSDPNLTLIEKSIKEINVNNIHEAHTSFTSLILLWQDVKNVTPQVIPIEK